MKRNFWNWNEMTRNNVQMTLKKKTRRKKIRGYGGVNVRTTIDLWGRAFSSSSSSSEILLIFQATRRIAGCVRSVISMRPISGALLDYWMLFFIWKREQQQIFSNRTICISKLFPRYSRHSIFSISDDKEYSGIVSSMIVGKDVFVLPLTESGANRKESCVFILFICTFPSVILTFLCDNSPKHNKIEDTIDRDIDFKCFFVCVYIPTEVCVGDTKHKNHSNVYDSSVLSILSGFKTYAPL